MKPGIATLTTDFGLNGPYVAAMKGVLLELAPGAQIVDVCHTISPQNILEGAFVLAGIVDSFPAGSVHLVVIDPGVGTERRLIAVKLAETPGPSRNQETWHDSFVEKNSSMRARRAGAMKIALDRHRKRKLSAY